MKIGVINRVIGVPPSGYNGTIAAYGGTGGLLEQYPGANDAAPGSIVNYAGGYVDLGGDIYFQFTSDVEGVLYLLNYTGGTWELVDPDDGYTTLIDQTVIIGNNCIRFIAPVNSTYSNATIKVLNLNTWYYSFTNALTIPEFVVLGYLLTEYPTDAYLGYSLRKIEEFADYCIQVLRKSDDAVLDIGFVDNFMDMDAIATFCGASQGFVSIIYNQVTNGASGNLEANIGVTATKNVLPRIWTGSAISSYSNNGNTNYVIDFAHTYDGGTGGRLYNNDLDFSECPYYQIAAVFAKKRASTTSGSPGRTLGLFGFSTTDGLSVETDRVSVSTGITTLSGSLLAMDRLSTLAHSSVRLSHSNTPIHQKFVQASISVRPATVDGFGASNMDGAIVRQWDSADSVERTLTSASIAPSALAGHTGIIRLGYNKTIMVYSQLQFCELVLWKGDTYDSIWETIKNFQRATFQTE